MALGHEDRRRQLRGPGRDAPLGGRSRCFKIGFAEPFGLSVVDALATGTPVIAHPLGSMAESIRPGRTGFLVADVDGAVDAVGGNVRPGSYQ